MSILETFKSDNYPDGRTKQAYKDQTDINKILAKAAKGQTISHLAKYEPVYGDFADIDDLLSAHDRLERGRQIFSELPSEVRKEFANNPAEFFRYVNDPANAGRLGEIIPGLAKPGTQMPVPVRSAASEAAERAQEAAGGASPPAAPQAPENPPQGAPRSE